MPKKPRLEPTPPPPASVEHEEAPQLPAVPKPEETRTPPRRDDDVPADNRPPVPTDGTPEPTPDPASPEQR